jgi:GPH family glycoside/pentoside/hexuronide:cation symporter
MVWLVLALLLDLPWPYSALSMLHQSWGARLGGDAVQRSRVVAWREGLGLLGVIVASISPLALGLPASIALLFVASWVAGWPGAVPCVRHN